MKIRIFSDSWYWSWMYDDLNSSKIKNKAQGKKRFPIVECYLNFLGYTPISYCAPSKNFYAIVNEIINCPKDNDITYNIVLCSSLTRNNKYNDIKRLGYDPTNYENFINKYNSDTIISLDKINKWAKLNDQQVILIGCQGTLYKEVFDKVEDTSNLHLVSECIVSTLLDRNKPFGIFKLSVDFSRQIDNTWDHDLVNQIYEDQETFTNEIKGKNVYTTPDVGHLNPYGALLLVDLILKKIEQLKGEDYMTAVVWSKVNCPYCDRAKALLKMKGIEYEERVVGIGWTKEQLLECVPTARTVPQIFLNGELVGGYDQLKAKFDNEEQS